MKAIIENGNLGSDGSKVELSGLEIPKSVPILRDFDTQKRIGIATQIDIENGSLVATLDSNQDIAGLFPAISFCAVVTEPLGEGQQLIKQARLISVGVSTMPNVDPSIPPIQP